MQTRTRMNEVNEWKTEEPNKITYDTQSANPARKNIFILLLAPKFMSTTQKYLTRKTHKRQAKRISAEIAY